RGGALNRSRPCPWAARPPSLGAPCAMAIQRRYYIGLMSGTSMDGVDGVLAEFVAQDQPGEPGPAHDRAGRGAAAELRPAPAAAGRPAIRVIAEGNLALPAALRAELLALNSPGHDE